MARNRRPTVAFGSIDSTLHTINTVPTPQIPLALAQHEHRLITPRVKPIPAAGHPFLHLPEGRAQPVLEPSPARLNRPAHLVQQLSPGNLVEPRDLVPHVTPGELDPGSNCAVAEFSRQVWDFADAAAAVVVGEVAPALEQSGDGRLGFAGGGFVELGSG